MKAPIAMPILQVRLPPAENIIKKKQCWIIPPFIYEEPIIHIVLSIFFHNIERYL